MGPTVQPQASYDSVQSNVGPGTDAGSRGGSHKASLIIIAGNEICTRCLTTFAESLRVPHTIHNLGSCYSDYGDRETVDGIAENAVEEILSNHASGPYTLVGFQAEGLVAFEAAMQLIALDKQVALVVMVETPAVYDAEAEDLQPRNTCTFCRTSLSGVLSAAQRALSKDPFCYSIYPPPFPSRVIALSCRSADQLAQQWKTASAMAPLSIDVHRISTRAEASTDTVQKLGEVVSNQIEATAKKIGTVVDPSDFPLVALRTPSNRSCPLLFCVPGAGDNATAFMELSSYIRPDCGIYGLQPRGIDGVSVPHRSVPLITESYWRALGELNLRRDIHILGHSYGGIVAFDLAVRMCNEKYPVKTLTLLDSTPPSLWPAPDRRWTRAEVVMQIVRSVELRIEDSLGVGLEDLVARSEEQQLRVLHGKLVSRKLLPQRSSWRVLRGPMRIFLAALRTKYSPLGTFEGTACSISAADRLELNQDSNEHDAARVRNWKTVVPNITFKETTGNHITMLRGMNAQRMAEQLPFNRQL
jgi:thioesterase domain-containing protein